MEIQAVLRARAKWRWRGGDRPPFAEVPAAGQESVWDYPRPPVVRLDLRPVRVWLGAFPVADSPLSLQVLETAGPPVFYLPLRAVAPGVLRLLPRPAFCEWKGHACCFDVSFGGLRAADAAWAYPRPFAGYGALQGCVAFHPGRVSCFVGDVPVRAQEGGYYGGWITPEVAGPFKGGPGTGGW